MLEKIEVLISAMYQSGYNIFKTTNISTDALLINQCDKNAEELLIEGDNQLRIISTIERGLSKSRNKAIDNAQGDICLLCDDDELLYDSYSEKIREAYRKYPDADIICFQVFFEGKKYTGKPYRVGFVKALRISSVQISFRLRSIRQANVKFDVKYGSGTPMGSGEENIFMYDCLKKGLKVYYVPVPIGEVSQAESKWFNGFNDSYFLKRGMIINRMMGKIGYLYCLYFAITKYNLYKESTSLKKALVLMNKGMKQQ